MKRQKRLVFFVTLIALALIIGACANNDGQENDTNGNNQDTGVNEEENENNDVVEEDLEPVTLKINLAWGEEDFNETWKEPIEAEFPHITLEQIPADEVDLEEHMAEGTFPDIVTARNYEHTLFLRPMDLTFDMTELIERHHFDLNRIEENVLERAYAFSDGDGIEALPFERGVHAMYYNKDIFDRFGVSYPENGMTWSEVIDIARDLSREEEGVQYRGLDMDVPTMAFSQLNANYAHPETGEPMYTEDDAFVMYYDLLHEVWSIPGNMYGDDPAELIKSFGGNFAEEQNVAMLPLWNMTGWLADVEEEAGMNWDMVTYPTWDHQPDLDPQAQGMVLGVSPHSEHQDEAFQVIAYMLSDEIQMQRSQEGAPSVLSNQDIHEAFASEDPRLADKNTMAFFTHEPAPGPDAFHEFEHAVENASWDPLDEFARLTRDTATHLRELQDLAAARVEEERQIRGE